MNLGQSGDSHWGRKMFPWSNTPRFYPPGQHPAAAQWREALRKAEDHKAQHGSSSDLEQYLSYLQDQLVAFEQGESDAKAREA